jgi:AcrR family transcriptional regulator
MWRTAWYIVSVSGNQRQKLLEAAITFVAGHGLTDLSLRRLAGELGTSHRMLIHHFGSKEALWVAIVREIERRQLATVADLVLDASVSFADATRAWWRHISDPSLWPNERLFFEVYGQGLQGRTPAVELLDGIVDSWLEPTTAMAEEAGLPRDTARAFARLGIAVTRGLLLDLLATGDRAGVDAAMEHWIALNAPLFAAAARPDQDRRS